MSSNPVREWGSTLLFLGAIIAVFSGAFAIAQFLLAAAGPRTYGFADTAIGAGWLAVLLLALGGGLRLFDYVAISRPRRSHAHLRPR